MLWASLVLTAYAPPSRAHEVPARVAVLAFVKPGAGQLHVLVRVPLESIRDVNFPLRAGGMLDVAGALPLLDDAARLWIAGYLNFREEGRPLAASRVVATRLSLPSDRSFERYDLAAAHLRAAPLDSGTQLPWQQAMLDVELVYPIASETAAFSLRPTLAHLGVQTTTVVRFVAPSGEERVYHYVGNPGLIRLDPGAAQAFLHFVSLGLTHILSGLDHLLFVLCLVIPFRRFRPLVAIVTSFTVAHSITLLAAARGFVPSALWFPPLIETLIALSIVYMALENILAPRLERRWLIAFGFGLVHGFGFSFALGDSLQFAGRHLLTALLSFNVGVELGQLLVIAVAVPLLAWLFRSVVPERAGTIVLSALVAHSAWHWMTARGATLTAYELRVPAMDAALAITVMRGLMALLLLGGVLWGMSGIVKRWMRAVPVPSSARARNGGAATPLSSFPTPERTLESI
ncbi:MAG: HupE/UreJ family protein [Gemmatimonadaceae bacterium]